MRLTLTKRCEYGIRILLYLAEHGTTDRVTAAELAERCQVPAGNVPTIVNLLSRAGMIHSSPGRGGGCTLGKPAEQISVLDVVALLDGPVDDSQCFLDSRRLHGRDPFCALHGAWNAAREAVVEALAKTSLAEALERQIRDRTIPLTPTSG